MPKVPDRNAFMLPNGWRNEKRDKMNWWYAVLADAQEGFLAGWKLSGSMMCCEDFSQADQS
jgi:hypothetical protein